ncbi:phosphoribosylamine--glycine ligase [Dehalogenimonas alkenigignens]|uniref:phosphoribosylamine--glycine ligase n=1 Tax=Dehalogenimonas alkenigignens TaxID=1217799 RepID=UPI000D582555|nr:phosphoribosylamine--glycine ligase [Dehalogenimonas alkenigignens]PVV84893.1 phosphoribosylamine--glycine ligase [Dehalogenimonas alkenigignens]
MKVLVIGSGGREHAIVWKIKQSPRVEAVFAAPGNGGTANIVENLDINPADVTKLLDAVHALGIDLVVIGPEGPLAAGLADEFQSRLIPVFGPSRAAAQLESSKTFARSLMEKYAIPCARGKSFTNFLEARAYLKAQSAPLVVKADGLAAGKGVSVCTTLAEAESTLQKMMEQKVFGAAGNRVIIEECLIGQEMSYLAFTDGKTIVPMPPACDYKRVYESNTGPNTGGMGAYSPPPFFDNRMGARLDATVMQPIVRALAEEGIRYRGVIYAGLMLTDDGPKVLEFNARFGDPETQVILPQLKTDLVDIMLAVIEDSLDKISVEWEKRACVTVVMASGGYPEEYKKGLPISGLDALDAGVTVFHAGTLAADEKTITSGGRVLSVTACGDDFAQARDLVYDNISRISFEGAHFRHDIALFGE